MNSCSAFTFLRIFKYNLYMICLHKYFRTYTLQSHLKGHKIQSRLNREARELQTKRQHVSVDTTRHGK